jgi:hypothetical protein
MLNLVAFDVCVLEETTYESHADPLQFTVVCPLRAHIESRLHTPIRKAIKETVKHRGMYAGKITLTGVLRVSVYKKRLHPPAYVQGQSPQDNLS